MTWLCSGCDAVAIFDKEVDEWACVNCGYIGEIYEGKK